MQIKVDTHCCSRFFLNAELNQTNRQSDELQHLNEMHLWSLLSAKLTSSILVLMDCHQLRARHNENCMEQTSAKVQEMVLTFYGHIYKAFSLSH